MNGSFCPPSAGIRSDAGRSRSGWLALLIVVAACLSAAITRAGETAFHLREHLNLDWRDEWVAFPFSAAMGDCRLDSIRLDGPDGKPVPVQLFDIEFWPASPVGHPPFIRAATVAFIADLAPLSRDVYVFHHGSEPAGSPMPSSDLTVTLTDSTAGFRNAHTGIELALGSQTFEPPIPPDQAPAPVRRLRLSDGTVYGGSRLFGTAGLRAWSGAIIEHGPVFARARYVYTYADGHHLTLEIRLGARQREIEWFTSVTGENAACGFELILSDGLPPLRLHLQREWGANRPVFEAAGTPIRGWAVKPLDAPDDAGMITRLTPWADWWDNWTQTTLRLQPAGFERELHIERRDAGRWVDPAVHRLHHKLIPLHRDDDGVITLRVDNMGGVRSWVIRDSEPTESVGWTGAQVIKERPRLDVIKDYILEWPSAADRPHPRLYMDGAELDQAVARGPIDPANPRVIWPHHALAPLGSNPTHFFAAMLDAYLGSGRDGSVARQTELADGLGRALARLGDFDKMRYIPTLLPLYDVIIDSDLVSPSQRQLYRAQMAYLGYLMADPSTWSVERNYRSFNFNMTVAYLLNQGLIGCLLADHPAAPRWSGQAVSNLNHWLDERVGPAGEFPESSSYTHVSVSSMIAFALAARQAGLADFFADGPFKRLGLFLAKQYTPRDPFRRNWRVIPPVGRHTAGHPGGAIPGIFARATADSDPAYSRLMQWTWNAMDRPATINVPALGGLEQWALKADLPADAPDWPSHYFPDLGVVLRQGVGGDDEHYISMVTNPRGNPDIWAPELGGFARWFFRGRPIGGAFAGGERERHELLRSRVMPARGWTAGTSTDPRPFGTTGDITVHAFTAMPRLDLLDVSYALTRRDNRDWFPENMPSWPAIETPGNLPLDWRRQVLYLKSAGPDGPAYLVLRDTVRGQQPSIWQFWTLSETIGPTAEAADRDAVVADAPGSVVQSARRLQGDRLTAVGQLDADIDFFVAAPAGTPRSTVRFGGRFHAYVTGWFEEYQDALHLQLPGDGHYYVTIYPRLRDEPPPAFRTLADGAIIAIEGAFGSDYAFLSDVPARVEENGLTFDGTAGAVMHRGSARILALGAPGEVAWNGQRLACTDTAVTLVTEPADAWLHLPADHAGARVSVLLPGRWTVAGNDATLSVDRNGTMTLEIAPGTQSVQLLARP